MDVKNVFTHGDLQEEVRICPPPGYVLTSPGLVRRLRRSLYALKQAPRAWFEKFGKTLQEATFVQSQYAHLCFFDRHPQE